ncbi:hypothetical protein TURU_010614 [Turdus rufiventris]|nr:hypothetical protein TURU_010614 [Turdus rufiventris]
MGPRACLYSAGLAEETEPEIITCSLSLGELHDLRREFTRQTNESILTWLFHIWDAAANDTILGGSEARQLGSLSRHVVIDQGIGRTQETLSLWRRLLTSVKDRYLFKEDLQVHQGKRSTMEQESEDIRKLNTLPGVSDYPSSVGLLRVEQQQGITVGEVFEKGEKITQILLKAGFGIKQSKVKGPAREIQFLGVKWQDGHCQIPAEVINKVTVISPLTSKKETQAFLGAIGFWRTHIPEYSQIVSALYLVTHKKNNFYLGPEQRPAFAQIKQEITHAVALGPVRMGPEVKNVLYSAAGNHGLSWSLWQKVPGETRGRPLGFWSRNDKGSEANYAPSEKEILAAYEGVQEASEVICTETQLLLAPTTEEEEQVTYAEDVPPYNELPETERRYALFTDGSCRIIGTNWKWKASVWSPTQQVAQATMGKGGSSQVAELIANHMALDIAK